MSARNHVVFSDTEEYLASFTPDGIIYVWNTLSGKLQSEYMPSSHLSATCSCLSWCPLVKRITTPKKKKRKTEISIASDDLIDLKLLSIGTETGAILLYSVTKGNLHGVLENEHSGKITGVCWSPESSVVYSCSSDKYVVEWNLCTMKSNSKWKASDSAVNAICLLDESKLLTASTSITVWSLSDRTPLQTFVGHATEIWKLIPIHSPGLEPSTTGYFISSAVSDRTVHAWQFKENCLDKAIASYILQMEPVFVDVSPPKWKEEPIMVLAVTRIGQLFVFEHHLNGRKNVPFKPRLSVTVKTHEDAKKHIPILAAVHCNDSYEAVIMYGNVLKPRFERVSLNTKEKNVVLIRENDSAKAKLSLHVDKVDMKIAEPKRPSDATTLGPGQMVSLPPRLKQIKIDETRRSTDEARSNQSSELSLSIDERLKAEKSHLTSTGQPTSGNFTHLLVQALQNRDEHMLRTVLERSETSLIEDTIKKLPDSYINRLLTEVQRRLFYKGDGAAVYLKWLNTLLQLKFTVILKLPDVEDRLLPVVELLRTRCDIFDRIYKLRGRLNVLLSTQTSSSSEVVHVNEENLLQYDDSSTENEGSEDGESESEDEQMKDLTDDSQTDVDSDEESETKDQEHQEEEEEDGEVQESKKTRTNHDSEMYSEESNDSNYSDGDDE